MFSSPPPLQSRSLTRCAIVAFFVVVVVLWHFADLRDSYHVWRDKLSAQEQAEIQFSCEALQGLDDIFLILRTGANDALEKLPPHLNTTLRCFPPDTYGIWSDMEEVIGGHHVGNALGEVNPDVVASHSDFEYYRHLQEQGRDAFSVKQVAAWAAAVNTDSGRDSPGWRLDKWKFLPLVAKAYRQRPEAKWFIFMECDSYISWHNMLQWLSHIDPSKPYYMGMPMIIGDVIFAYGGASFVISNPAMKLLVENYEANQGRYEDFTGHHWAGDCVLGKAMLDAGVPLSWLSPTFFGDRPSDLVAKGGGDDRHPWCYYAMTYHHMTPPDIDAFFRFEHSWNQNHSDILRHGDAFRYFVLPKISPWKTNWDNLSQDEVNDTASTFEGCRMVCEARPDCVQFLLDHHQKCKVSSAFTLGQQRSRDGDREAISGWNMDRVGDFVAKLDALCHGEGWMLP